MASQKAPGSTSMLNPQSVTLELMKALATNVLRKHVDETDLCVVCGSAWPSELIVLAEHNLTVIGHDHPRPAGLATLIPPMPSPVLPSKSIAGDTP